MVRRLGTGALRHMHEWTRFEGTSSTLMGGERGHAIQTLQR